MTQNYTTSLFQGHQQGKIVSQDKQNKQAFFEKKKNTQGKEKGKEDTEHIDNALFLVIHKVPR